MGFITCAATRFPWDVFRAEVEFVELYFARIRRVLLTIDSNLIRILRKIEFKERNLRPERLAVSEAEKIMAKALKIHLNLASLILEFLSYRFLALYIISEAV